MYWTCRFCNSVISTTISRIYDGQILTCSECKEDTKISLSLSHSTPTIESKNHILKILEDNPEAYIIMFGDRPKLHNPNRGQGDKRWLSKEAVKMIIDRNLISKNRIVFT